MEPSTITAERKNTSEATPIFNSTTNFEVREYARSQNASDGSSVPYEHCVVALQEVSESHPSKRINNDCSDDNSGADTEDEDGGSEDLVLMGGRRACGSWCSADVTSTCQVHSKVGSDF